MSIADSVESTFNSTQSTQSTPELNEYTERESSAAANVKLSEISTKAMSREQRREEVKRLEAEIKGSSPKPESQDTDSQEDIAGDETPETDNDTEVKTRKKSDAVPYNRFKEVNDFATEAQRFATEAIQRATRAEQELERLKRGLETPKLLEPAQPEVEAPPDMMKFNTQGEYMQALSAYQERKLQKEVDRRLDERFTANKQQEQINQVVAKTLEVFEHKVEAAAAYIPEIRESVRFLDKLSEDSRFPAHLSKFILDSEHSPEIAHFLHKNQDILREVITTDPFTANRRIAEIDFHINAAKSKRASASASASDTREDTHDDIPVPRKLPNVTKASKAKEPHEMSRAEFREWARNQEKRRR